MTQFSSNIAALQPSATIAVSSRVKQLIAEGRDVLNLCAGEPDFNTPSIIAEAGVKAIREGQTRYTPAPGIPVLRAAIARDIERFAASGARFDPRGVVVSAGVKQALFNVLFSLFGPGDSVLIPKPYWTSYPELVQLARAEPVIVDGDPENDYKVDPARLEAAAGPSTRAILLNSPCNPTGATYTLEELRAIAEWARERDVWIISDEIYRRIYFKGAIAPGIFDLPAELTEKAILLDGTSKAFAMTGWRIGFSYTSPEVAEKLSALQSQTTSNASTPAQYAALAAYEAGAEVDQAVEQMRAAFQSRRDLVLDLFATRLPGVSVLEPDGAFYFWVSGERFARPGEGSVQFCERLLNEYGVGVVPGIAFGDDRYFRMSFAYSEDTLRDAVNRLEKAL
ncbi:MAG TPA: pyridoxal phosphate-dependent aminotransferase [Longimicrobiaceae bacterium]